MRVRDLLAAEGLELDDVRWYLASDLAGRLLEYRSRRQELARLIWSGRLEAELYHAEERFLDELQGKVEDRTIDEPALRSILADIANARRGRRR